MDKTIDENNYINGNRANYQCDYKGGKCTISVKSLKNGTSQPFTMSPTSLGSWLTATKTNDTVVINVVGNESLSADNSGVITLTQGGSDNKLFIHAKQTKKDVPVVDPTEDLRNITVRYVCAKGDDLEENVTYQYLSKTDGDADYVTRTFNMSYGNGAFRYGSSNYSETLDESNFVVIGGQNLKYSTAVTTFTITLDDRSKRQELYNWLQNEASKSSVKSFTGDSNFYIKDINGNNPYEMKQTSFYAYRGSYGAVGGSVTAQYIAGPLAHNFIKKQETFQYSSIPQLNVVFIAQPQASTMGKSAIVKMKLTDISSSAIGGITGKITVKIKYETLENYFTKTIDLAPYAGHTSEITVTEFGSTFVEKFIKKNDIDTNVEAEVSINTKICDSNGKPIRKIVVKGTTTAIVNGIEPWFFENQFIQQAD